MTQSQAYRSEFLPLWEDKEDGDFDDHMTDEDFDRRWAQRDGWVSGHWDGRW